MNNMAHKRRRWKAWERYVRYCLRRGQRVATGGMNRYGTQRFQFHTRKIERRNDELWAVLSSLTGIPRPEDRV